MSTEQTNLGIAMRYLATLERGAIGDELAAFFAPDVVQEEFPNRLVPNGARRGLADLLDGAKRGQQVMSSQRYDVQNSFAQDEQVLLEVAWSGTLAIALGSLAVGDQMRARFAVVLAFRDGKIITQRNYDCFDPW